MQRQVSATPSLHFGQLGTVRLEQNYCRLCCYYYYYCRRCFCRKRCLHRRPQRYPACFIRPDDDDVVVVVVADSPTKPAGWLAGRSVGRSTCLSGPGQDHAQVHRIAVPADCYCCTSSRNFTATAGVQKQWRVISYSPPRSGLERTVGVTPLSPLPSLPPAAPITAAG